MHQMIYDFSIYLISSLQAEKIAQTMLAFASAHPKFQLLNWLHTFEAFDLAENPLKQSHLNGLFSAKEHSDVIPRQKVSFANEKFLTHLFQTFSNARSDA